MPHANLSHPGIREHPHPTFENRTGHFPNLPDLSTRFCFVGTSGSGKGYAMLDLFASRSRPRRTATVDPLAAGYWLLVTGCLLLVTGGWLLVTGCWLLAAGYRGLEAGIRTIGCWLLAVLDHWLWTGGWLL